jgi:hypothetical protein
MYAAKSTYRTRMAVAFAALAGVLLWQTGTAVPVYAAPVNLVTNGGFETGAVTPWAQYPANKVTVAASGGSAGDASEGSKFAAYPAGSSLSQQISGLTASQGYLLTAELRNDPGVDKFSLGLRYFDAQHPSVVEAEKKYSAAQDWTKVDVAFSTDSSHTAVNILTQNNSASGSGSGYLDDVQVIAVSAARVSIQNSKASAATLTQQGSDPAAWSELQSALAAANDIYWDLSAADADVQAAADRLAAAVQKLQSPPPKGIVSPGNTTYYVSQTDGDDMNDGLTAATAWKSIAMVSASTFAPGDKILLKAGDAWTGTTLQPKGNGESGNPITVGEYGSSTAKPSINAQDAALTMNTFDLVKGDDAHLVPLTQQFYASVYLYNQQYWTIQDLDVSNHSAGFTNANGDANLRNGIMVMNDNGGTLHDVDVLDNHVHDVLGSRSQKAYWGGAGINFTVMLKSPTATVQSNYDNILIRGNYVHNTNRQGIVTNSRQNLRPDIDNTGQLVNAEQRGLSPWYPSTGVVIRNNYVKDVAGDGILPQVSDHALVEYNTVDGFNLRSGGASAGIWAWNADNTVFQFNEASGGHTTQDGEAYDLDYGQTGTVYQYNYSHDNDGGFMLVCAPAQGSDSSAPGNGVRSQGGVVRYNISQNDKAHTFMFSGYSDGTLIYNNTLYQAPGVNARPIDFWAWASTYPTSVGFYNNVFDLQSAGIWNFDDNGYWIHGAVFDSNTIFGVHTAGEPADDHKSTNDPKLAAPGSGTTTTTVGGAYSPPSVDGYKLAPDSPDLLDGKIIETSSGRTFDETTTNGGRDYFGNRVVAGTPPSRGAFSGSGLTLSGLLSWLIALR